MIKPLTPRQQDMIVRNVVNATHSIDNLTKSSYKYLYLCSGFIAHYDHYGFMAHYSEPGSLRRDIISYAGQNEWRNFRPGDEDYAYYASKAEVYRRIVDRLLGELAVDH
jgi:hypothetical protein